MNALITGIEGFVGPYLAEELLRKGYNVIGTYRDPTTFNKAKTYKMDILDRSEIDKVFSESKPEFIFHLAGISNVKFSIQHPDITERINVEGTRNVLDAANAIGAKVLLVGSAEEYGVPEYLPIDEKHELKPKTPYGGSKKRAELLGLDYLKKGLSVYLVRSFNHIGPGQTEDFVCSAFAKQIVEIEKGKEPTIFTGNLEARRDFTDVRDVVKAYVLLVEKGAPGKPYNVCSGNAYEINEILERLLLMTEKEVELKLDSQRQRKSEVPVFLGTHKVISEDTGWEPQIAIEESLKDILEYWRRR